MTEPGRRPYREQLADTLAFAVEHIPWYRERADLYRGPLHDNADLARLPIIDRATVVNDQRQFVSSDRWPSAISYSSSTTGGIGQPRWRGDAERRAMTDLYSASMAEADDRSADGTTSQADTGVTLVIHPYDQGPPQMPADVTRRLYVAMLVPWHFDLIHQFLRDGWRSPSGTQRVEAVDCFSPGLRILTEWFEQRQIDVGSFGVDHLFGYGSIQPAPWRRRLATAWGATYHDLYGLTDVVASDSDQCPLCRAYHFGLPIVPEVVDPVSRQPVDDGLGVLLLTELYPYAQVQVLMRYWTDDLVELARPCPFGGFGFLFRGRRSSSVVIERDDQRPLIIGSLQVGEICADSADVAISEVSWAPWAKDVGAPKFALSSAIGDGAVAEVRVVVELRFSPALFPARAAAATDDIYQRLQVEVTGVAEATGSGQLALSVDAVGPGQLVDAIKV